LSDLHTGLASRVLSKDIDLLKFVCHELENFHIFVVRACDHVEDIVASAPLNSVAISLVLQKSLNNLDVGVRRDTSQLEGVNANEFFDVDLARAHI